MFHSYEFPAYPMMNSHANQCYNVVYVSYPQVIPNKKMLFLGPPP